MPEAEDEVNRIAGALRAQGARVERAYKAGGIKNQMAKAGGSGAPYALILGADEIAKKTAVIKDMKTGEQSETPLDGVTAKLSAFLPR